jgi:predicted methyltransferase
MHSTTKFLKPLNTLCALLLLAALLPADGLADHPGLDSQTETALQTAIGGAHRSDENRARDQYRRPMETLAFFGFRSDATVVEFAPGGGWYTEILAAALHDDGTLYAAHYDANASDYARRSLGGFLKKIGDTPDVFGNVIVTAMSQGSGEPIAPPASADFVLTFRNVHNWMDPEDGGEAAAISKFSEMFRALKPGGVLGVVEHRWPDAATEDAVPDSGYVSEERVIALASAAGFELEARSDLNRNPLDTHDHPNGVWTLPPSLDIDESEHAAYIRIGESDRMTLKFRKPAK